MKKKNSTATEIDYIKPGFCIFNDRGIECPAIDRNTKCHRCGWNPSVQEERAARIRREYRWSRENGTANQAHPYTLILRANHDLH